jgi:hypothetical protein
METFHSCQNSRLSRNVFLTRKKNYICIIYKKKAMSKSTAAYLFVFGVNYCGHTSFFLNELMKLKLPFIYCAFNPDKQTKQDYWKSVHAFYPEASLFTFPSVLFFTQMKGQQIQNKPLTELRAEFVEQFELEQWQGVPSISILAKLSGQADAIRPMLRETLGCDSSSVSKYFDFERETSKALQNFEINKSFVFCPLD